MGTSIKVTGKIICLLVSATGIIKEIKDITSSKKKGGN